MTQIPKRSLHTCIAPARILRRHAENEPANLAMHARSARPPRPRCPLLRDQFAMPAKERVWCHKRRDVAKGSSADLVSQHSQAPTLIVGQLNAAAAQLRLQGPILFAEEVNDSTLLSLEPTHEHHEQKWNGNTRQNLSESTSTQFSDTTGFNAQGWSSRRATDSSNRACRIRIPGQGRTRRISRATAVPAL